MGAASDSTVRLTFVSSHAKRGGSEWYLSTLVTELGQGWVQEIVCLEQGPLVERLRAAGYRAKVVATSGHPLSLIAAGYRLRRLLFHAPADAIHANGVKAALVSVIATIGLGVPVIWVKHDFSWDGALARLIALRSTGVVCVSRAVAGTFPTSMRHKVYVIHPGIPVIRADRSAGRSHLRKLLGSPQPGAIIALVGTLHPFKGHMELLQAVTGLVERIPDVRVVLIGGPDRSVPEHEARLRQRVSQLGLDETVSFLGHRDDAIELLSGCDAAAIPSQPGTEGLSLVALESQAVGTPVVAHAVGGLPEALGDCGLLVQPGDARDLTEALVRLITDAGLSADLAHCGRDRVRNEFSLARMVDAMKERYREAARLGTRRRRLTRGRVPPVT